ncbi:type II toxin-antitoxin system RelE family toxin [Desulfobacter vibrioformis]|uniref:type II toxin-antitoxin system RelE family toxin n=1 Tax=Desulfobacter vibrioformis TaxID=34031 RepID=UPI00054DA447|nr:type II toxin-antitoxin system RelE/ParE family toxin [Desulfobacter vibrioformis]
MAVYKIFFKDSVWKDFKSIPDKDLTKILACIESLGKDHRQPGCKKLSTQERYRLRHGRYRIIYSIQDNELSIWVVKVGRRKSIYK